MSVIVNMADTNPVYDFGKFFQQDWVHNVIQLALASNRKHVIMLTGDAGVGKTYAVSELYKRAKRLNIPMLLAATTINAVGVLNGAIGSQEAVTMHSVMGFRNKLVTEHYDTSMEFMREYKLMWKDAIAHYSDFVRTKRVSNSVYQNHGCPAYDLTCSMCMEHIHSISKDGKRMKKYPQFVGHRIILVDEYGLLTAEMYENLMATIDLFSRSADEGPVIILCGSVSQLSPPEISQPDRRSNGAAVVVKQASAHGIWTSDQLKQVVKHVQHLPINRRQAGDVEYGEALSLIQFNLVTVPGYEIFHSRAVCTYKDAMDPKFMEGTVRIFHQNALRKEYLDKVISGITTERYMRDVVIKKTQSRVSFDCSIYDIYKYICSKHSRLFAMPPYDPNLRRKPEDYLRSRELWIGSPVWVSRFGDYNPPDTVGEIISIEKDKIWVHGKRINKTFPVRVCVEEYKNWHIETIPLTPAVVYNTYESQGTTVTSGVIYHPPSNYDRSPLKASAYVACSRVTHRQDIHLTSASFAPRVGEVNFYSADILMYRKTTEMGYK